MKALPLMPGSLNLPVVRSAMTKSKKPEISIIRLKASLIKMATRLNSIEILTLTGSFKKIRLIMGLKEHASVDTNHGFVLATTMTPASVNDTNYLPYCTVYSRHTKQPIEKVFADKGYAGKPNRDFLALNKIADGIMRKDSTTAKLTEYEKDRNKKISQKFDIIVEQYFGLSHLHDGAKRARFTDITKNKFDGWYRQAAFNISRGLKILRVATV